MPAVPAGDPIAAIRDHSDMLAARLDHLAEAVTEAVADGDAGDTEALAVFSWYRNDLLPQIKATEATLYEAGRARTGTALLVRALESDHGQLRTIFEDLDAVEDPGQAAAAVGAARALLHAHLGKEVNLLLPALADEGVDVQQLIDDHPEMAGGDRKRAAVTAQVVKTESGEAPTIPPVSGTEEVDVRPLGHDARHGMILGKMQALTETGKLIIVNDHDPLPLKYQAEAMWPDQFVWKYLDEGPEAWRVSIERV